MQDKTFELIEKMYSEFTEFRKETKEDLGNLTNTVDGLTNTVDGLTNTVDGLTNTVDGLSRDVNSIGKIVIRIENTHGQKLDALFDGYKQSSERLTVIEEKIDLLSDKVDRHDIRIQVIEGCLK